MRIILSIFGVLIGVILVVFILREPIASSVLRQQLEARGISLSSARVTQLSLSGITIEDIAGSADALRVKRAVIEFDRDALFREKRVRRIDLTGAEITVAMSQTGEISIPALQQLSPRGNATAMVLPFDALKLDGVVNFKTPQGIAMIDAVVDFHVENGGDATLDFISAKAGTDQYRIEDSNGNLTFTLEGDGEASVIGSLSTDVIASFGVVRDIHTRINSKLLDWRVLLTEEREAVAAAAQITIENATVNVAEIPGGPAALQRPEVALLGGPINEIYASGVIEVAIENNRPTASIMSPLVLRADNNVQMTLSQDFDMPLYETLGSDSHAAFTYTLEGGDVSALGSAQIVRSKQQWYVFSPLRIQTFDAEQLAFRNGDTSLSLTASDGMIAAEINTSVDIDRLEIGRLRVSSAPFTGAVNIDVDRVAKEITVQLPKASCAQINHADVELMGQDLKIKLDDASLCAGAAPLNQLQWSKEPVSDFSTVLSARRAELRIGQTVLKGAPPQTTLDGVYVPRESSTRVEGELLGGQYLINSLAKLSKMSGRYAFVLEEDALRASADIDDVIVEQITQPVLAAPMRASAIAMLENNNVIFSYDVKTMERQLLGRGEGEHATSTGRGNSSLKFERLEFAPENVQPEQLAPILRGVIGETTGAAAGEIHFRWRPANAQTSTLSASALINFDDLTFQGPTRAVTQTIGVDGDVMLAEIWPLTTQGMQTLSIRGIDLDAFILNDGTFSFSLPGDDTLRIEKAEFPWFRGLVGAYDARISFAGDEADISLRVDDVELQDLLDYADVDGLSGSGVMNGVMPLTVKDGRAFIEDGALSSTTGGVIRYAGNAASQAAASSQQSEIAFDILRNLEFDNLDVSVNGPLDGRLIFQMRFDGRGAVTINDRDAMVPVIYRINLDAALLELLDQANLSRRLELQIERAVSQDQQ